MSNGYQGRPRSSRRPDDDPSYDYFGREAGSYRGQHEGQRNDPQHGHAEGARAPGGPRWQSRDADHDDGGRTPPHYDALGRYYDEHQGGRSPNEQEGGWHGHGSWREEQAGRGARFYGDDSYQDHRGAGQRRGGQGRPGHHADMDEGQRQRGRSWEEHYDNGGDYGDYPAGRSQRQARWQGSGPGQGVVSRSADPGQSSYGGFTNEDTRYQHQQRQPGGYPGDQEYRRPRMGESDPREGYGGPRKRSSYGEGSGSWGGGREASRWDQDARQGGGGGYQNAPRGSGAGLGHTGVSSRRTSPKGYVRSDDRIREDVCERLSHSGLDVSEVSVEVKEGHVTLEGAVDDRWTKHAIENCADDCMGVSDVDNRIRVQRSQGYSRGETAMDAAGSQDSSTQRSQSSSAEGGSRSSTSGAQTGKQDLSGKSTSTTGSGRS